MASVPAQLLSQHSHRIPGKLHVTEYFFRVPLDHTKPSGPTLRLFARGVTKAESPSPAGASKPSSPPPWLTYFQGGPGFGCRPPYAGGWIGAAIDAGYRVLLLDQRGTGLSQPITPSVLAAVGKRADEEASRAASSSSDPSPTSITAQAAYLKHFRAPSIVEDAEAVRKALALADGAEATRKWSVIGQSFGGFCVVHYLSKFPDGLAEAFTLGGLPPISQHPQDVYPRLIKRWIARTDQYYAKYPEDEERVSRIAKYLSENDVEAPMGGKLTVNRLRELGMGLGFHGGFERMHNIIQRVAADLEYDGQLSGPTALEFESGGCGFDHAILYALLHEPCYLQGGKAAHWAAEQAIMAEPVFQTKPNDTSARFYFTAEAIRSSIFDDYKQLRPLKALAQHLEADPDWSPLYDTAQLRKNTVPTFSATYLDDQYVDFDLAQEAASNIKACKVWITNAAYHDAVRAKADDVMRNLMTLRDDVWD